MAYLLGLDIGSSSVKAALVDRHTGRTVALAQSPDTEMAIQAPRAGWAEQDPEIWWQHACSAIRKARAAAPAGDIAAIGIAYQMHGLVTLDAEGEVVRPAIIWCDSRAVTLGDTAFEALGQAYCLEHYLNSPGNFTASKLKWVRDHEPHHFERIRTVLLPGDYIAYRLTGERQTTVSGLSEGIFWDFKTQQPARRLLEYYGYEADVLAETAPAFAIQGRVHAQAAAATGLAEGTPITYRAGDQPNNALSLNVLQPGEIAATAGTSGVVYGVVDRLAADPLNRVNSFAHVNHTAAAPRIGILLCINGAGITYSWLRRQLADSHTPYSELEQLAASVPAGAEGLLMLPFGNGAERMLGNRHPGASLFGLDFNRHHKAHVLRAGLEGVAFSLVYGIRVMQSLGLQLGTLRVGNDNLFQSAVFAQTVSTLTGARIDMLRSSGAAGAAIASGVGIGQWSSPEEGLGMLEVVQQYVPGAAGALEAAYDAWAARVAGA
jgi:xylulokinase